MRLFALQGQTLFAPQFRSAQPWAHAHNPAPPRGVGDAAPYNNPQGFSLPQTSAAAWGQAALHPNLPHSVGRAFARNSFTPPCRGRACPARSLVITTPFILCIVGRQATGPLHNRPAPSNTKTTCLRPLAGRLFLCFKFFSVPFLLRKGTNPRLVKITSGQSPQPRRPAPAGPAGSARPSGR